MKKSIYSLFFIFVLISIISCTDSKTTDPDPNPTGTNGGNNGTGNNNGTGTNGGNNNTGNNGNTDSLSAYKGSLTKNLLGAGIVITKVMKVSNDAVKDMSVQFYDAIDGVTAPSVSNVSEVMNDAIIADLFNSSKTFVAPYPGENYWQTIAQNQSVYPKIAIENIGNILPTFKGKTLKWVWVLWDKSPNPGFNGSAPTLGLYICALKEDGTIDGKQLFGVAFFRTSAGRK